MNLNPTEKTIKNVGNFRETEHYYNLIENEKAEKQVNHAEFMRHIVRFYFEKNKPKPKKEVAPIDESQIVHRLPCKGGEYPLLNDDYQKYCQTYAGINVRNEIMAMHTWLTSNKAKQKTKTGMPRFINSWLSRASEKQGNKSHSSKWSDTTGLL